MKGLRIVSSALMLSLALTSFALAAPMPATQTIVVTDSDVARQAENTPPTKNWVIYTRNAGTGTFQIGPATPPLGVGSLGLSTPTGADKVYAFNYDHAGTPLSAISDIRYATYVSTPGAQEPKQAPALNIEVDVNGAATGGFTTLVFEPIYNTDQGTVTPGIWQPWDAYNGGQGRWWSTKDIPGVCAFNCFVPWSTILANNPGAVIVGGFGVNQGSGNPGLVAAADALTIGHNGTTTTYNFEPFHVATNKDACMNGGWATLKRADGSAFKNQGDCIQYVNTGK